MLIDLERHFTKYDGKLSYRLNILNKIPLKIFFRENEKSTKRQIYCVLIANFLLVVIKRS
jgi:hypothetical protein